MPVMPTVAGVGAPPPDPADALLLPVVELWLSCSRLLPQRGTKCEVPWLPLPSAPPLSKIANEIGNVKAFVFFTSRAAAESYVTLRSAFLGRLVNICQLFDFRRL